jgi:hypothetical protein
MRGRAQWIATVVVVIALGLASRRWPQGWRLWDKYLGDALYAVMIYAMVRLVVNWPARQLAMASMVVMTAIEAFQLTGVPARLGLWGRLLGTTFAWADLAAYAVGILCIAWWDRERSW